MQLNIYITPSCNITILKTMYIKLLVALVVVINVNGLKNLPI